MPGLVYALNEIVLGVFYPRRLPAFRIASVTARLCNYLPIQLSHRYHGFQCPKL